MKPAPKTIQASAAAYRDLNATLGNFYEQPKNDKTDFSKQVKIARAILKKANML